MRKNNYLVLQSKSQIKPNNNKLTKMLKTKQNPGLINFNECVSRETHRPNSLNFNGYSLLRFLSSFSTNLMIEKAYILT
jgi:hypothetical protein